MLVLRLFSCRLVSHGVLLTDLKPENSTCSGKVVKQGLQVLGCVSDQSTIISKLKSRIRENKKGTIVPWDATVIRLWLFTGVLGASTLVSLFSHPSIHPSIHPPFLPNSPSLLPSFLPSFLPSSPRLHLITQLFTS